MAIFDLIFNKREKRKNYTAENINGVFIKYVKHPFSRCVKITPKTNGEVLVTLPKNLPYSVAKDFALKNIEWIKQTVQTQSNIPPDVLLERRKLARKILPKRLEELAKKFGFKYGKVFIKNQSTVWGSCSFKNNINLNLNLVALNDEFIDYVLLHELTHTVHKNHQKAFYTLLTKNMPNALEVQRKLKKIRINSLSA